MMMMAVRWTTAFLCWLTVIITTTVSAFTANQPAIAPLLEQYESTLQQLRPLCHQSDDDVVSLLRFCLSNNNDDPKQALETSLQFKRSERGQRICQAAQRALASPNTKIDGTWNNQPVMENAPHSDIIGKYITPTNCVTTTSRTGDLVYCIRAGAIDDTALMQEIDVDGLVDFFLYIKEIHSLVANKRSTNKLVRVITCNDLSGIKLVGGSADFRKALSESSKLAATIYPSSLAGPTLLLNLPALLSALVKLFTPLFPESVKARLKFQQGPLKKVKDLRTIATSSSSPDRTEFLDELDALLY